MAITKAEQAKPEIRYTKGPSTLSLGDEALQIGEWKPVSADLAKQANLEERKAEYGFEVRGLPVEPVQQDSGAEAPTK